MSALALVEPSDLAPYVDLARRVKAGELDALMARWEFGQRLLAEREANGGKQLPHGRIGDIADACEMSQTEVRNWMQFADEHPTAEAVANAFATFGSWHAICKRGLGARSGLTKLDHPAPYSRVILDQVAAHLREAGHGDGAVVLDPFAGTGRVHDLRDLAGVTTVGVEIEPEWAAKHPDTIEGNALDLATIIEAESVDAVVTSPTYGNGLADLGLDNPYGYTGCLGRPLHADNSGSLKWGPRYRTFHETAWPEAVAALKPGGTFTLNIKNHPRGGTIQRVAEWHIGVLLGLGLVIEMIDAVASTGLPMAGEHTDKCLPVEQVVTFRKGPHGNARSWEPGAPARRRKSE